MTNTLISIRTLQIERKALREALKKYGSHLTSLRGGSCPGELTAHGAQCNCGWTELEKQL